MAAAQYGQVRVKLERVEELREDVEDAQETLGFVVQSENNKMTEIDELKAKVARLERELEEARAGNGV